jgi:hypothetical protein
MTKRTRRQPKPDHYFGVAACIRATAWPITAIGLLVTGFHADRAANVLTWLKLIFAGPP